MTLSLSATSVPSNWLSGYPEVGALGQPGRQALSCYWRVLLKRWGLGANHRGLEGYLVRNYSAMLCPWVLYAWTSSKESVLAPHFFQGLYPRALASRQLMDWLSVLRGATSVFLHPDPKGTSLAFGQHLSK